MSKLYIIPTPIGNLKDITIRAIDLLSEVDLILAEDTRVSKKILNHYDIDTPLYSFHQFNEHKKLPNIISKLKANHKLALISDAGTPGISDPGFLIVRECIRNNIQVECLPGATAFVPALVNSGLSIERFVFEGFLPVKKGRLTRLNSLENETRSIVFYESPHRLLKTLKQFCDIFGETRQVSISREISKIFEENKRGSLKEILAFFEEKKPRGEFVIILSGKEK
jgi:16S rRNA (cytidine1402-2'-O)-methyltransferase|tara:strand:- start:14016 stop:14690 length:675 start_codon:yes stop_codon:yes gene_type:complete